MAVHTLSGMENDKTYSGCSGDGVGKSGAGEWKRVGENGNGATRSAAAAAKEGWRIRTAGRRLLLSAKRSGDEMAGGERRRGSAATDNGDREEGSSGMLQ